MPDIDLGDDYDLDEDSSNNLVITHTPSGSELRFDSVDELFEFASQARFTDSLVDSNGKTIYDVSTGTVGDGSTSADHESVSTDETSIGGHTSVKGIEAGTVAQSGADNSTGGSGWDTSAEVSQSESFETAFDSDPDVAITPNGDAGDFSNAREGMHYITGLSATGFTYRNRQYAAEDRSEDTAAIDYVAVEQ